MPWLTDYCNDAQQTDRLAGRSDHVDLLATGLFGETGSVLAELKKAERETAAYPSYRNRLVEEIGDLLWYLRSSGYRSGSIRSGEAGDTG